MLPALFGYPVHHYSGTGDHIRSYGSRTAGFNERGYPPFGFWGRRDSTVWVGQSDRYELEKWNLNAGTRSDRFIRKSDHFRDLSANEIVTPSNRDVAAIMWVREDDAGLLWVGIRLPDRLGPTESRRRGGVGELETLSETFDFLIEVIDPASGNLIAHRESRGYEILSWIGADRALLFVEDVATGVPTAAVITPRLVAHEEDIPSSSYTTRR
jgi:hypothetical protein